MRMHDIPDVLAVQAESYAPHMNEEESVVRRRFEAAPDTAWVVESAGAVTAYLVAYPSLLGQITPLAGSFTLPNQADCLYLHDLAVMRRNRGTGAATRLVERAFAFMRAQGLRHSALVAVQDSRHFWENLGYRPSEALSPAQENLLASYRTMAAYMTCCR